MYSSVRASRLELSLASVATRWLGMISVKTSLKVSSGGGARPVVAIVSEGNLSSIHYLRQIKFMRCKQRPNILRVPCCEYCQYAVKPAVDLRADHEIGKVTPPAAVESSSIQAGHLSLSHCEGKRGEAECVVVH